MTFYETIYFEKVRRRGVIVLVCERYRTKTLTRRHQSLRETGQGLTVKVRRGMYRPVECDEVTPIARHRWYSRRRAELRRQKYDRRSPDRG